MNKPTSVNKSLQFVAGLLVLCFGLIIGSAVVAHDEFVEVIANSKPAVVIIEATRKRSLFRSREERERDELLGEYAEYFEKELKDTPRKRQGTGFVISADGLILTAAHVVRNSTDIKILFEMVETWVQNSSNMTGRRMWPC